MSELTFCYEMTHWTSGESNQFSGKYVAAIHWARRVGPGCTGVTWSRLRYTAGAHACRPFGRQLFVSPRHWNNELTGFADIL
jgi:hypothetical protein